MDAPPASTDTALTPSTTWMVMAASKVKPTLSLQAGVRSVECERSSAGDGRHGGHLDREVTSAIGKVCWPLERNPGRDGELS